MTFRPFVRQLGYQPGVQLNPLIDTTDGSTPGLTDQIVAVIGRMTRGRTDRPFRVNRGDFFAKTGPAASIKANALNEAKVQAYEALSNGAYEAVVQRLVPAAAKRSFAVIRFGSGATFTVTVTGGAVTAVTVSNGGTGYTTGQAIEFAGDGNYATATVTAPAGVITGVVITSPGTGYTTAPTARVAQSVSFTTSETAPTTGWDMYLDHLGCFNDGIKIRLQADATPVTGTQTATKLLSFQVLDVVTGEVLADAFGSLDINAVDDYGNSIYLPDVLSNITQGEFLLTVRSGVEVAPTAGFYGRTATGTQRSNTSAPLVLFSEGGFSYTDADMDRAMVQLKNSDNPFGYLMSGGTQSATLLGKMVDFAKATNTILVMDISGRLAPAAAIAFWEGLNVDSELVHAYYAPIEAFEPSTGYREVWGVGGLNAGLRCGRNARVNAKGFAPKNYPVAGREWPMNRSQMRQIATVDEGQQSDIARARLNLCHFVIFSGGGRYVFGDSLTSAKTQVSYRKLVSVAEMASSLDNMIAAYARELIQLPMKEAITRMNRFLQKLLEDAFASDWLIPSTNLEGGAPFIFTVERSSARPVDLMVVNTWISYDGVARQVTIQQRISK